MKWSKTYQIKTYERWRKNSINLIIILLFLHGIWNLLFPIGRNAVRDILNIIGLKTVSGHLQQTQKVPHRSSKPTWFCWHCSTLIILSGYAPYVYIPRVVKQVLLGPYSSCYMRASYNLVVLFIDCLYFLHRIYLINNFIFN